MTVESDIKTVLATACTRVFPDFAPVGTTRPYVTYREVPGGTIISPLAKEVPDKENSVFQINVWANSRASAKATIKAIESAMIIATAFTAKPVSRPSSDFDADIPEFSTEQEFSVWSSR